MRHIYSKHPLHVSNQVATSASINLQEMDNSGQRPLCVPGFGGMSLYYECNVEDGFANAVSGWEQEPAITAPEFAMLQLMNDLTDKHNWHMDIFNNETVAKWREETFETQESIRTHNLLGMRRISAKAWDWSVMELRDKVLMYKKNQFIRILDAGSSVCKSDALVSESLRLQLKDGMSPMMEQLDSNQDQSFVDPSLFPLVYGKTLVLVDGGQVGLHNCFKSYGHGELSQIQPDTRKDTTAYRRMESGHSDPFCNVSDGELERFRWSSNFQLLPCDVQFSGESGTDVHISSYINNLHPIHYKTVYCAIEKLISVAIKPWNECLIKGNKGGWPLRIRTFGLTCEPEFPHSLLERLSQEASTDTYKKAIKEAESYLRLPDCGSNQAMHLPEHWDSKFYEFERCKDGVVRFRPTTRDLVKAKWKDIHQINNPEPGVAFSYVDWKAGRNGAAIREKLCYQKEGLPIPHRPQPDYQLYSIKLQDTFRDRGLQVIVKIGGIELSPDKPTFTDDWHMDGFLNDHIVATAIYYYDVENVTQARISFRCRAYLNEEEYHYQRDFSSRQSDDFEPGFEDMASMLGFDPENFLLQPSAQEIGSVTAPQGRLITWPNTLQYRVEPISLVDVTIPGHRRFITLSLVDPHYRVCSTQNVPPQRHDWWAGEISDTLSTRGIPREVADLITDKSSDWLMSMDEARQARERLMQEHKWTEMACDVSSDIYFRAPYAGL